MVGTSLLVLMALAALGVACIISYSKLMKLYDIIKESYMILDMNFKRRWDMTSTLLGDVDMYIKDKDKLNEIKEIHIGSFEGLSRQRKNSINGSYSKALLNLIDICKTLEDVPESVQESVNMKIKEIEEIEAKIAINRTNYNFAVLKFNDLRERFPHYIMVSRMRIKEYEICS